MNLKKNKTSITSLLLFAFVGISISAQNPIIRHVRTADPSAHVWGDGKLWIYTSGDNENAVDYTSMDGYRAFSTTDMVNYEDHGVVLHSKDLSWGIPGYMFAPTATYKNGKYYIVFPHSTQKSYNMKCGVAVSDFPQGPFKSLGIINGVSGKWLDPCVFTDDDGTSYLYWGVNNPKVAKLKDNMTELAENPRDIVYGSNNFFEASYMHKKDGIYYFSYNIKGGGHYAMGDNPYGPFTYKGAVNPAQSQDHHSIVEYKGQWYFFYHVQNWNGGTQFRRNTCVEYLHYDKNGTMLPVYPTKIGVAEIK